MWGMKGRSHDIGSKPQSSESPPPIFHPRTLSRAAENEEDDQKTPLPVPVEEVLEEIFTIWDNLSFEDVR